MTPLDFKTLRNVAIAEGHDAETLEFIDNLWAMAPAKTCEGMLAVALGYDMESFTLLARLLKSALPRRSFSAAPDIVNLDDWSILFVPGDLHLDGNLPIENTMVIVLGGLTVTGVIGSYRDFEVTRFVVLGDLNAAGLEGDKDIFVEGTVSADIIWFDGKEGLLVAKAIDARILYSGSERAIEVEAVRAEHTFSPRKPVNVAALESVLAPEAFVPETGYVFEGHPGYGCVNRALRLLQLGRAGLLHH
ncbi:MAG: hypothetical protein ACAI38_06450 [Myxococcota bacterium]|nr:hypothetical protein [Myxococcota bacterium]